jgi:hypothetical protein
MPLGILYPKNAIFKNGHPLWIHTNTIVIFLIEITTNEHYISLNNPLNYSLKYGKTAKFGNVGSKLSFIAKNLHLMVGSLQVVAHRKPVLTPTHA